MKLRRERTLADLKNEILCRMRPNVWHYVCDLAEGLPVKSTRLVIQPLQMLRRRGLVESELRSLQALSWRITAQGIEARKGHDRDAIAAYEAKGDIPTLR